MNNTDTIYYFRYNNLSNTITTKEFDIIDEPENADEILPPCAWADDYIFIREKKAKARTKCLSKLQIDNLDGSLLNTDHMHLKLWSRTNDKKAFAKLCYERTLDEIRIREENLKETIAKHENEINITKAFANDLARLAKE